MPSFPRFGRPAAGAPASSGGGGSSAFSIGRRRPLVGLQITSRAIRLAALQGDGRVQHLAEIPLPPGVVRGTQVMQRETLVEAIQEALQGRRLIRASGVISIGGTSVLVRRLSPRPRMGVEELVRTLPNLPELRSQQGENTIMDAAVLDADGTSTMMQSLAVVTRRSEVEGMQVAAIEGGLNVRAVDTEALAVYNCFQRCQPEALERPVLLLHIDEDGLLLIYADQYGPIIVRPEASGLGALIEEIRRGHVSISEAEIREQLLSARPEDVARFHVPVEAWADRVATVTQATMAARRNDAQAADTWLTGDGAAIPGLGEAIGTRLGVALRAFNPLDALQTDSRVQLRTPDEGAAYVVPLGLALRQLEG